MIWCEKQAVLFPKGLWTALWIAGNADKGAAGDFAGAGGHDLMEREEGRPEAGKGEICRGVRNKSKGACESCSFVQGLLNHAQYLTRYLGFGGWRSVSERSTFKVISCRSSAAGFRGS